MLVLSKKAKRMLLAKTIIGQAYSNQILVELDSLVDYIQTIQRDARSGLDVSDQIFDLKEQVSNLVQE